MRTSIRSARWIQLVEDGDFLVDAKLVIDNVEYTDIRDLKIERPGLAEQFGIGGTLCSSMSVTIKTENVIPKSAEVEAKMRLKGLDGDSPTNWVTMGKWYINDRDTSYAGLVKLECFDKMLLLEVNFPMTNWPKTQVATVQYIANYLDIELDSRNVLDATLMTQYPFAYTMRETLGHIGACNGGNWIITEDHKLRLVPLFNVNGDTGSVIAILKDLRVSAPNTITGVTMSDTSTHEYEIGDSEDAVITSYQNPSVTKEVAQAIYDRYLNMTYQSYTCQSAIYDPAFEAGDILDFHGIVTGQIYDVSLSIGGGFRADLTCPEPSDMASEYPSGMARMEGRVNELANQEMGGRNYIRESNTLTFDGYSFVWKFKYNGNIATLNGNRMEVRKYAGTN